MRKRKNRIYSKQVLHLTSTPPLSKIRSAGILSIWQKETTSSHIWTAINFEYFDLTKIRFFEISWFFPGFQQNFKFPDFSLQGFFFSPFSLFSRVRGHPVKFSRRPWRVPTVYLTFFITRNTKQQLIFALYTLLGHQQSWTSFTNYKSKTWFFRIFTNLLSDHNYLHEIKFNNNIVLI